MPEVLNMFFDDQIVDTLCTFTNAEASRVVQDFNVNAAPNKTENLDRYRACGNLMVISSFPP